MSLPTTGAYPAIADPTVMAQKASWSQGSRYPVKLMKRVNSRRMTPRTQLNSRGFLYAPVRNTRHMCRKDYGDHAVRGPAMHVAQEGSESHGTAQVEHTVVGLCGRRHVVEHQQDASDHQDQEQEERHQSQAQRIGRTQCVLVNLDGMDVQKEVGEAGGRPFDIIVRKRIAEHRTPHVGRQLLDRADERCSRLGGWRRGARLRRGAHIDR